MPWEYLMNYDSLEIKIGMTLREGEGLPSKLSSVSLLKQGRLRRLLRAAPPARSPSPSHAPSPLRKRRRQTHRFRPTCNSQD